MSNWFARLRQKSPSSNSSANGAFPIDPSVPVSPYATDRRYRLPDEAPPSPQPGFERTTSGTAALWRTDTVPFTEPQPKDHLCLPDAGNIINARVDGVSPLTVSNASTIYNAHDNDDDSSSLLFTTIIPQKPRHDDTVVTKPSSGVSPRSAQLSNATSPPRLSSMPGTDQTTPYSPSPPQTMSAATIVSPPSPVVTTHYGAQTTPGIAESRKSFWQEKAFPSGDTYAESPAGSDDSPPFTPPRTDVRTRTAWLEQAFTPSGGGNMESPTKLQPESRLETQRAPPVNIEPCPMESCLPPTPLSQPQSLSTRKEREPPPEDLSSPGQAPEVLAWRIRDKSKDTHAWAYNIWYRQGLLEWCPPESSVAPTSNSTQNLPPFVASSMHPHRAVVDVPDDQGTLPVKASPLRFRPLLTHKQKENDRPKVSTVSSMGEVESSRTQTKNCSKDPTVGSYQQLRVKVLASKEDVEKPVLIEPVSSDVVITEMVKSETVECEKDSMDIVMNNGIKKQFTAVTPQGPSVSKMSDHPAQYLNTGNEVDVRQENHDSKKDAASFTDTAEEETVKQNDRPKVSTVSSMGEVESSRTQAKNCSKDPTVGSYQQLRVKVLASKEDVEKPVLIEPVSSDVVITEKVKSETVECEKDSMDIVMNNGTKKQFTAVTPQGPSVSKMSDHPAQYLNTGNEVDVRQENHDSKKDAASFIDTAEEETVKQNDRPKVSTVSSMGEVESSRTQTKNCSKDPTVGSYQQLRVKVLASKEEDEKRVLIEPVSSDVVITEKVKSETVECEKDSMDIVMNNGTKKQFTAVTPQGPSVSKMSDHPAQYLNTGNEVDVRQENHDSKKDAASFTDTAEDETVSPALIQGLSVSRVEPIQQHQDTQSQDLASMCGNDSQSVGASGSRQEPLTPLEKARRKRSASRAIAGHVRMVTSTRYTSFQKSRRAPILSLFGGPNPVGVDVEERPSVDSETQSSLPNSKGNQERGEAYQEFVSAYRNYSRDRTSPAHYATRIQALDRLNAAKVKNRVPPAPRRIDGV